MADCNIVHRLGDVRTKQLYEQDNEDCCRSMAANFNTPIYDSVSNGIARSYRPNSYGRKALANSNGTRKLTR